MREVVLQGLLLSLWGGAATLGALAISAVLRRAHIPSRLLCWLWLAVGLRFALPWGIPLTLPRPRNQELAQVAERVQAIGEAPAPVVMSGVQAPVAVAAAAAPPWYTQLTVWHLLAAVWAVGVAVLAVRALWGYRHLARTVATACKTGDGCYSGDCVPAPFTLGILRPRIYLPATLTGDTRQAVLLHERTHLRRHDPQVKPLFYAVVCLHWFNPLAWLAFRQLEREMESACDEAAVRDCDAAARNAYCESILRYALQGRMAPGSLAFGQGSVKTRIVHLLHYRKIGAGALLVCVAAVGLSVTACMMKPEVAEATPETAEAAPTQAAAETPDSPDTPETAITFTANTAGLPNLDDPENSPRFLCPTDYTYIIRYEGSSHRGDDLKAERGTPVYAAQDGVVTYADYHYSYGNFVVLDHGAGPDGGHWSTLYAHMEDYTVASGQTVKAGDVIGHVGSTGNSTGNHLHFEVQYNNVLAQPSLFTAYREGDTNPLTAEDVQELRDRAAEEQSVSEDSLLWDSQKVTETLTSLKEQRDRLTARLDQLKASLEEIGPQFPGTEEERQQLRENMETDIQTTEEQIRLVEEQIPVMEQQLQVLQQQQQEQQVQTQLEQLQQDIADSQSEGTDPVLEAGEEQARRNLDAAAQQMEEAFQGK